MIHAPASSVVTVRVNPVAVCVAATLDHYFFNLGFPPMAAIFWTFAGLGEVALRLTNLPAPAVAVSAPGARSAVR